MNTKVFYTTNAGLYFSCGTAEILIDGIQDAGAVGFSPMPEKMQKQMQSEHGIFVGEGTLLFTHLHKDHYDKKKVKEYIDLHPETALWGPGIKGKGITIIKGGDNEYRFSCGDFTGIAYKTRHSGERFAGVPHYSLLLRNDKAGEAFFIAGDALLEPDLAEKIHKETEDSSNGLYAFFMAYQLVEGKSRAFIKELSPSHLYLIHRPRPEDDAYRRVSGVIDLAKRYIPEGITIEEPKPMSWIR